MLEKNIPKSSNFKKLSDVIEETNFNLKQHKILKRICEENGRFIFAHLFQLKLQKN